MEVQCRQEKQQRNRIRTLYDIFRDSVRSQFDETQAQRRKKTRIRVPVTCWEFYEVLHMYELLNLCNNPVRQRFIKENKRHRLLFLVKKIVFLRGGGSAAGQSAASVAEQSRRVAAGARGAPEAFGPRGLGKFALAAVRAGGMGR